VPVGNLRNNTDPKTMQLQANFHCSNFRKFSKQNKVYSNALKEFSVNILKKIPDRELTLS
jgi:hypothetical protein